MLPIPISQLLAVAQFTPDDATRPVLNCVAITRGALVATDSKAMAKLPLVDYPEDYEAMISLADIDLIKKVKSARKIKYDVTVSFSGGLWSCSGLELSGKCVEGRFPNWRHVWPKEGLGKPVGYCCLDPDYLIAARKAWGLLAGKQHRSRSVLAAPSGDEGSPWFLRPACGVASPLQIIVMPVRVD
jgi:hypothetical protein